MSDLGGLAHAARVARGWSQQEAADAAGVSRRFVNMLEGGQHANAEVWRVLAVLDAVGVQLAGALQTWVSVPTPEGLVGGNGKTDEFDLDVFLSTFRSPRELH